MTILLRLKHWQFFLIIFGLPFFVSLILNLFFQDSSNVLIIDSTLSIISLFSFLAWFYSLGINLHKKLPETVKMNLTKFKILFIITAIYSIFFFIFLINLRMPGKSMNIEMMKLIMPVHLVAMVCIIYCMYFMARALKAVELQKPVSFNDASSEFIQFFFYPIGIWFIQPKINKVFASEADV